MVMRPLLVLIGAAVGMVAASSVAAEPRDRIDRGQRLDTDALRDDIAIDRLRVPSHPLVIAPPQQPVSNAKGKKKKTGATGDGSR